MATGLDLTADQRAQIQSIRLKTRDEAGQLRDELTLARRTLRRQVFADKVDNPKLAELSARIASLHKQLADIRVKALLSTSAVLTPEQRQKMRVAPGARAGRRSGPPPAP